MHLIERCPPRHCRDTHNTAAVSSLRCPQANNYCQASGCTYIAQGSCKQREVATRWQQGARSRPPARRLAALPPTWRRPLPAHGHAWPHRQVVPPPAGWETRGTCTRASRCEPPRTDTWTHAHSPVRLRCRRVRHSVRTRPQQHCGAHRAAVGYHHLGSNPGAEHAP